ncbi:MAG TPA: family 16 glycosylhydrolase [Anaerolineales bacterium]|nr:family 16 glycosylhydrolase [Anaerolineales bacterium]
MKKKSSGLSMMVILSLLINGLVSPFASASPALAATLPVIDDFESGLPSGTDGDGAAIGFITFRDPNSSVAISTTDAPPAPVPGASSPNNVLKMDLSVVSFAGFVHNFENAAVDTWVPQDWSAYEGISFWLYGNNSGTTMFVDVLDNRNPGSTRDDAERWSIDVTDNFSGWREIQIPFESMHRKEIGNGAPNDGFGLTEVHGWALGTIITPAPQTYYVDNAMVYGVAPVRPLTVGFTAIDYRFTEGTTATLTARLSKPSADPVSVQYATGFGLAVPNRDYIPTSGTLTFPPNITQQSFTIQTIDNQKYQGERGVLVQLSNPTGGAQLGIPPITRLNILDNESFDPTLLDDFETYPYLWQVDRKAQLSNPEIAAGDPLALPGQGAYEHILQAGQRNGRGTYSFSRTFPIGQDWSDLGGLNFWYYGRNSNKDIGVSLDNNLSAVGNPSDWRLVWSDEFNARTRTAPNASVWGQEVGDGTVNGIPGWGNSELEYYTDGTNNVSTDGQGNLQITVKEADGSLTCYYGPCEYTSARLLTKNRFEVAYGRLEARVKVPEGAGLWPAFWMLGTDIDQVSWPQTGEIDIMEFVGRVPNEVFGTLHGPGYSGGQSYGDTYDVGEPVGDQYHVFSVEWQPDYIAWYIDGIQFFAATPDDPFLQGKQWVFNHPFFILMNVAVGGNFGGPVGEDTVFPQSMLVDYVRLYQTRPTPVSFNATFRDDFTGWRQISLPFSAFQNADGHVLDLSNIQTLRFEIPDGLRNPVMLDQIRLSAPCDVTVTNTADAGVGSLRRALASVCAGGTVTFSEALAGQTITLLTGPLTLGKNVTIDASAAPGLTISGNDTDRVFIVNAGTTATVKHLTVTNGFGFQLAGGILNNGSLTLDHVTVTDNTMTTNAGDFWQGGGGIYSGDGATLNLIDSSVSNNQAAWSGGGVYAFFNTTTTILRSTISGNVSNDVGGGIRSLGDMTITNSTISGNRSTGWHGGAIFQTDGDITITNSTIANNIGPDWAPSTFFIGQFGGSFVPTLTLTNTIITGNQWYACERFASGTAANVLSGGNNLVQDDSCNPVASDLINSAALIGPLANNGGPTQTHALLSGSPAINAANDALCPPTDQRGITRPQGMRCDIGSYESP